MVNTVAEVGTECYLKGGKGSDWKHWCQGRGKDRLSLKALIEGRQVRRKESAFQREEIKQ